MPVIPAPFGFFEMEEEELWSDAAQFDEAKLGVAPKALNAVDVIFATGELVFMMMNAAVFVTAKEQAVITEPSVGIDRGFGKNLSLDDRLQLCPGAVFHHAGEDLPAAFEQPDHRRLATRPASPPAPHAPGAKVGFVDLDFAGEGPGLLHRQFHDPAAQQLINPLAGLAVDSHQFARGQRRHIRTKHLQNLLEFTL